MKRQAMLLSGILAAALTLTIAPYAAADPPPWARAARQDKHCRDQGNLRGSQFGAASYGRYNPLLARIQYDRSLIAQWQGTGRHEKVVRWAYEDIEKAKRELYENRAPARFEPTHYGYDPYYRQRPPYYGPNSAPQYGRDPYYGGDGFDWKRDWPLLLGTVINGQTGR